MINYLNYFVCEKKQKTFFQSLDCIKFKEFKQAMEYSNTIKSGEGSIIIPICSFLPKSFLYPVLQYKLSKHILRPMIMQAPITPK